MATRNCPPSRSVMDHNPSTGAIMVNMINLPATIQDQCQRLARDCYPHEACGLLLASDLTVSGRQDPGEKVLRITGFLPARNTAPESILRRSYQIDPRFLLNAQRTCRERGLAIAGIFHTHPDHPPVPSPTDLQEAWPVYVYMILHVRAAEFGSFMAWRLDEVTHRFHAIQLAHETNPASP